MTDPRLLESVVRDHLNKSATRVMAVLDPIKVVITDFKKFPVGFYCYEPVMTEFQCEWLEVVKNTVVEDSGTRKVPVCSTIYIEREDFSEAEVKGLRFTCVARILKGL